MREGIANVTIGGYASTKERSLVFSCSNAYLQASIGFCYKERMGYLPLTAPLGIRLWLVLCVILLVAIVLILLTKKLSQKWRHFIIGGKSNRSPIFNCWATLLGMCICNPYILHGKKIGTFARTLVFFWILLWFVIRSSYQAALYTSLQTHQLSSAHDTIAKIRQSNCKVTTSATGYSLIKDLIQRDRYCFFFYFLLILFFTPLFRSEFI